MSRNTSWFGTLPMVALMLGWPALATAAPHWGPITRKDCVRTGTREWSGILWDVPWGQSWERACARTKGRVDGARARVPDRCVTSLNEWGVWHVRDSSCRAPEPPPPPPSGQFLSFTTDPQPACADAPSALVRIRFSVRSSGDACMRFRVAGVPYGYAPQQCGRNDWSGSVTFSLDAQFGVNVPESFTVEGFVDTKTSPLVIPKLLDTARATVTTRLCSS